MSALEKYGQASAKLTSKFLKSAQMEDSLYSSSQATMKSLDIDDNEITEPDSDSREDTNSSLKNDTYNSDSNILDLTCPTKFPHIEVPESLIDTQLFDIDKPAKKANLMSLLSGKQSETKLKKKPDTALLVIETDVDSSIDEDVGNSSFTDFKADTLRKEHDLIELERKFYKQGTKSVTSKDFLDKLKSSNGNLKRESGPKRVNTNRSKKLDTSSLEVIDLSQNSSLEDKSVLIISDEEDETKILESKVFSDTKKSSSVRDLLKPLKATVNSSKLGKKKKEKPKDSFKPILYVTLKINSDSLAEIKKYENPLKTRGNFNKNLSLSCNNEVQTFDMKSLSSSSFFQSMMDASKTEAKLIKYQSSLLKLPSISKNAFHVVPHDSLHYVPLQVPYPKRNHIPKSLSQIIKVGDKSILSSTPSTYNAKFKVKKCTPITKDSIKEMIPSINESILLLNIYENYVMKNYYNNECMLWVDFFHPKDITEVLISPSNQKLIADWISNAYSNLKAQSLKNPRNLLMKQKRLKLNTFSEMSDFIVDDFGDDYQEPDTNVFIPLLIIQGSTGSCKSSSVYAYMNQINGYVYEINSGQHRGRKDIFNNLKEFATTQLVHRQEESKEFQKGLVLFEDVNILYEQDKNFWQVIQDIINITRRPIVLTCDTLENIPKNILKYATSEDSIINLDNDTLSRSLIKDYLWLCSISQNFNIDSKILDDIILESYNGSNYDLRKCLMKCQYLCSVEKIQSEIEYNHDQQPSDSYDEAATLSDLASEFELASISDVIRENSLTQINNEPVQNEFTDISYIDSLAQLYPATLPYELNIGEEIQKMIKRSNSMKLPILTYQTARDIATNFISSRAKKLPKLLIEMQNIPKRQTRSARSLTPDTLSYSDIPETTGIMESSFLKFATNTALITELLPFSRDWLRFQVTLDQFEEQQIKDEKPSIKSFLKYRDFHYSSKDLLQSLNFLDLLKIIENYNS